MPTDVDQGKLLDLIKSLVAGGDYHYSAKIRRCIEDGWYAEKDLEQCILSATSIRKIEEDELGGSVDGRKYVVLGGDSQGWSFYTCGKIVLTENDSRVYFFITAHEAH